jgi:type IV fimbrial biogenesis protein FimT
MFHRLRITEFSRKHRPPFICPSIPFVCRKSSVITPSICQEQPLVGNSGFTLIELIITLTVAGILLAIAAPNFSGFLARNRLTAQINDFSADLSTARVEAIKRNRIAGVCTSNTGTGCVAGNWANGWMVFVDEDSSGGWSANDIVVSVHESLPSGGSSNTLVSAGGFSQILYNKTGIVLTGVTDTYTLCDPKSNLSRVMTISVTGRPSVTEGTC